MLIIGITGTLGAGKGTIVEYLVKKKKFKHFSVREYLSNKIIKEGKKVNRDTLVEMANRLREKNGPDFLAQELYKKAVKSKKNSIIESLRTEGEINVLKSRGEFYLFAVDAKPKTRYGRIVERGSETDKVNYKKFLEDEKRELKSKDPTKQNLSKCIEMANFRFDNNGSLEELYKQVDETLEKMKKPEQNEKYIRPSWDEYFLEVMNSIAKRATCDRGRAGTVIVKDNQILATGYVGSPVGMPHCDDVGHDLRKSFNEDGTISQHCVRTVHSEQNAICQAAKRGISIQGATVYTRMTPCRVCAMLLINCGISKVYCERKYHTGKESEQMFKKTGIKIEYKFNELQKYSNQKG